MTEVADAPWQYHWLKAPRPFVHPVTTPRGRVLSVDGPTDHPWHHGLWFTIKFVNGVNFWEEYASFGLLKQASPPTVVASDAEFVRSISEIDWIAPDGGSALLTHRMALRLHEGDLATTLDWHLTLEAHVDAVLDRTPYTTWGGYGGLAFRGRSDWATVLRLDGDREVTELTGERSRWCCLTGLLAEEENADAASLVVLDHPANPRHPVPWYAMTTGQKYGVTGHSNFLNAAFLFDGPLEMRAGEKMQFGYRVITRDGMWTGPQIDGLWHEFAQEPL